MKHRQEKLQLPIAKVFQTKQELVVLALVPDVGRNNQQQRRVESTKPIMFPFTTRTRKPSGRPVSWRYEPSLHEMLTVRVGPRGSNRSGPKQLSHLGKFLCQRPKSPLRIRR